MTKHEIIQELVSHTDLTTSQALHAVDNTIDIIADALVKGDPILLRGFAKIETVVRAPKAARDIRKGTALVVPARRSVKFTAYKALKARLNSKK